MVPYRTASIAVERRDRMGRVLIAFVLAPTPPTLEASAAEIVKYSTEHHSAALLIAAFLFATTAPLFTVWSGALAARLRDAEERVLGCTWSFSAVRSLLLRS